MAVNGLNVKTEFINSKNRALNEVIIGLAILKMVAGGFEPLKIWQIPLELALLSVLLYACTTIKFDREQIFLLLLLVFVTACSFVTSDIRTSLINGKQNFGAILSLLYFSNVRFRSRLIFPAFALTLLLIVIDRVVPDIMTPLISLSTFEAFNESRFGGLFLNVHFNAFFMAVALIYYGYSRKLFGIGIPIIYITGSKVVFVAYLANLVATRTPIRVLLRYRTVVLLCVVLGIYVMWRNLSILLKEFDSEVLGSAVPILMQLFDPAYYKALLNPFPAGYIDVSAQAIALYRSHGGNNEIGYFQLAMSNGVFLGALYLFMLLRCTRYYRVFILVCMLHYGFPVLEPLIIYMLLTYSREIHMHVLSKVKRTASPETVISAVVSA